MFTVTAQTEINCLSLNSNCEVNGEEDNLTDISLHCACEGNGEEDDFTNTASSTSEDNECNVNGECYFHSEHIDSDTSLCEDDDRGKEVFLMETEDMEDLEMFYM